MLILYILIASFIAWIWIDYFWRIDIYEKDCIYLFIVMFLLGGASVLLVFGINDYFLDQFYFKLNSEFINDFGYSVFKIGLVEETAKLIAFIIFYIFFKKKLNEPIDYIIFISVSALGFSAVENVIYFNGNDATIINGRAILSTVGHMFDTALIGYGIVLYKYKKKSFLYPILFLLLAAISHGFYDFWLIYEPTKKGGVFITILYFLITIEIYSTILNNSLNNSTFFSYKTVIDSDRINKRLLIYYGFVYLFQTIMLTYNVNLEYSLSILHGSIYSTGFIIVITSKRLSRFKLIQNRWNKISISFPFRFDGNGNRLLIKGDSYNESFISKYYKNFLSISPLTYRNTYLSEPKHVFFDKKVFLKNDDTFFLVKVFDRDIDGEYQNYLIKPKTFGVSMTNNSKLIVGLLAIDNKDLNDTSLGFNDFDFLGWCILDNENRVTNMA